MKILQSKIINAGYYNVFRNNKDKEINNEGWVNRYFKYLFFFGLILLFNHCSKSDQNPTTPPPPPPPEKKKVLRLDKITETAASGASLEYDFSYKDSLPIQIMLHNLSRGDSVKYTFRYDGAVLQGIDYFNLNSNSSSIPDIQLNVFYSGGKTAKAEFRYKLNDTLALSSYFEYSFDNTGKLLGKKVYSVISDTLKLSATHTFTYDSNNDITEILSESLLNNYTIKFQNTFGTTDNRFYLNNPQMLLFTWYLFDLNKFNDGFLEVHLFSSKNVTSTQRLYNGVTKQIDFNIESSQDNLWDNIVSYPDVYNDFNDILFQRMSFSYVLMP